MGANVGLHARVRVEDIRVVFRYAHACACMARGREREGVCALFVCPYACVRPRTGSLIRV